MACECSSKGVAIAPLSAIRFGGCTQVHFSRQGLEAFLLESKRDGTSGRRAASPSARCVPPCGRSHPNSRPFGGSRRSRRDDQPDVRLLQRRSHNLTIREACEVLARHGASRRVRPRESWRPRAKSRRRPQHELPACRARGTGRGGVTCPSDAITPPAAAAIASLAGR